VDALEDGGELRVVDVAVRQAGQRPRRRIAVSRAHGLVAGQPGKLSDGMARFGSHDACPNLEWCTDDTDKTRIGTEQD
jgi:hypothetical protein